MLRCAQQGKKKIQSMNPSSLRFKVNSSILAAAVVITVIFAAILYPLEVRRYNTQIERIHLLLDSVFQQKEEQIADELSARQKKALAESLQEILRVAGISGAALYLPDRTLFLSAGHSFPHIMEGVEAAKPLNAPSFEIVIKDERPCLVYSHDIEISGALIGHVRFHYDLHDLQQERQLAIAIFATLLGTILILMAFILNISLSRLIIQPVTILRKAMGMVEEGHLGQTVHIPTRDEIGEMGRAFNAMSSNLYKGQQATNKAERKYRAIFENAIEGIFQCSGGVEGRFVTVNPSMARLLGYESPEDLLQSISSVAGQLFVDGESAEQLDSVLRKQGYVVGFETRLQRKDGVSGWFSISARSHSDSFGNILYLEGSLLDITERREKETAQRERETAEAASRTKSEFMANMSHEIRTPINAILGFTDLLGALITDPKQKNYLDSIKSSGKNLMALLSDILDLSKIEAGKMEIKYGPVRLRSLFREIGQIFSLHFTQKELEFIVDISTGIPEYLMLDEVRIRQVLFNLIGNALKFTESGYVKLSASHESVQDEESINLILRIEDTGPGIHPTAQKDIFNSFTQQSGRNAKLYEGSGLGLSISKNLAERMGGSIAVESTPGAGSIFTVCIPGVAVCPEGVHVETRNPVDRELTALGSGTILVADDLDVNRNLIREFINGERIRILEADNGRSAIELAQKYRPDLILMDIKMPIMDGFEASAQLKSNPVTSGIPVIAVTASGMKEERDRILRSPFDDHLFRPFNRRALLELMGRFIGCGRREDIPTPEAPKACLIVKESEALSGGGIIPEIQRMLRNELMRQWEEARRRQRITEIEEFANRIKAVGDDHQIHLLSKFGESLLFHVSGFDIESIQVTMESYPALVATLEQTGCNDV